LFGLLLGASDVLETTRVVAGHGFGRWGLFREFVLDLGGIERYLVLFSHLQYDLGVDFNFLGVADISIIILILL
jgi:hypothetical protein